MTGKLHNTAYRRDPMWRAALVHRVSGLALACFLPAHFLALGLAIEGEARLDGFLAWTRQPLVKAAEIALVALLAVHLFGGIRILVVENLPWRPAQKRMAELALWGAGAIAAIYAVRPFL